MIDLELERERVKQAENALNLSLAEAGKRYVESITKAEDDYQNAPNEADTAYRTSCATARMVYELAIKNAEREQAESLDRARQALDSSPMRDKDTYLKAKSDALQAYSKAKLDAETTYNQEVTR